MGWSKSKPYSEMTQEERVNALLASQQMMSDENMTYRQQELPSEARFGGEFGLPSFLGYIGGKDRGQARIKTVGINEPYTFGSIGSYYRKDPQDTAEREKTILSRLAPGSEESFRRYYQGIPESDTIYIDYPADSPEYAQSENPEETLQAMRELAGVSQKIRDARTAATAGVLSHELEHRFYHSPFYKDMFEYYSDPKNIPFDEMLESGAMTDLSKRMTEAKFRLKADKSVDTEGLNPLQNLGLPQTSYEQHAYAINPIDRRFRPSLRGANIQDYLDAAEKLNINRGALAARPDDREFRKQNIRDDIKEQKESFRKGKFSDDDYYIEEARTRDFLIRHYLTPERQEQYGLRLPARETRAKTYEQLIEEQEESGVMDKIFALIGKLAN